MGQDGIAFLEESSLKSIFFHFSPFCMNFRILFGIVTLALVFVFAPNSTLAGGGYFAVVEFVTPQCVEQRNIGELKTVLTKEEKVILKQTFGKIITGSEVAKNDKGEIICIFANDKRIKKISSTIGNFTNLQYLDITGNKITTFPAEIEKLKNLEYLDARWNKIKTLPVEIGNLTYLKGLFIAGNKLITLPSQIGNLTNLEYLDISENDKLKNLPPEIGKLTNLKALELLETNFKTLPVEIENLKNLEYLGIYSDQFSTAQKEILQKKFKEGVVQF